MIAADKLAQVLAEHDCYRWQVDLDGPADAIVCGCGAVIPEQDVGYAAYWHRTHVAAVVLAHLTAEGWAQGHEEWATAILPDVIYPARSYFHAESDASYFGRQLVRRRVTEWEEA